MKLTRCNQHCFQALLVNSVRSSPVYLVYLDEYMTQLSLIRHREPTGPVNRIIRDAALYRITHQYEGKTIVIVCHGGIVDGSFLYFFGLNTLQLPRAGFDTHNTSITAWEYKRVPYDRKPRWRLLKYNDVFHLLDVDTP